MEKKKKAGLRQMISRDKANMLPMNFRMSYIVVPLYVVLAFLMIIFFAGLLDKGYVPAGLICLGAAALMTIGVFAALMIVRKKAVKAELDRYDFDTSRVESKDVWDFSQEELSLRFDRYGMTVDGKLIYYNHLKKLLITDNKYRRVMLYLVFAPSDKDGILIPLNADSLKMLEDFKIELDNQPTLDYILAHPDDSFKEIYAKGKVTIKEQ